MFTNSISCHTKNGWHLALIGFSASSTTLGILTQFEKMCRLPVFHLLLYIFQLFCMGIFSLVRFSPRLFELNYVNFLGTPFPIKIDCIWRQIATRSLVGRLRASSKITCISSRRWNMKIIKIRLISQIFIANMLVFYTIRPFLCS